MARIERAKQVTVHSPSVIPASVVSEVREISVPSLDIIAARTRLVSAGEPSFLLERPEASYLFLRPYQILSIREGALLLQTGSKKQTLPGNPMQALKAHLEQFTVGKQDFPRFTAGAVGYLGYDCVQYLEKIALQTEKAKEDEACFLIFQEAVIIDHAAEKIQLVVNQFSGEPVFDAPTRLAAMEQALRAPAVASVPVPTVAEETLPEGLDRAAFTRAVKAVKQHILAGDTFQCVLAERMEFALPGDPFRAFQALRAQGPAPYHYFFNTADQTLLGASPELLVRVEDGQVETCPIAGTRPRGETPEMDAKLERQLLRSPKERAEHLMLVDLSRNDIGRVCRPGTVRVRDFMQVERFSHVMHLVSLVEGELADGNTALAALFASFPAGTLTGAPKIRAMQIIAKLETTRRGAYGGAVVLYDFRGRLESFITIRSLVAKDGVAAVQAGAGVVADSVAAREFLEIQHKSRAVRRAIAAVQGEAK